LRFIDKQKPVYSAHPTNTSLRYKGKVQKCARKESDAFIAQAKLGL